MIIVKSASTGVVLRLRADRVRKGASITVCCALVLLWAIFAMLANHEQLAIWRQAYLSASNTARIIALDISRNLDVLDLTLRDLEGGLSFPGLNGLPLKERNLVLYNRAGSAEFFAPIIFINERGDLSIESSGITPPPLNYTDRDYFQFFGTIRGARCILAVRFAQRSGMVGRCLWRDMWWGLKAPLPA